MSSNYLTLRKIGNFYQVFDDDAYLLWFLCGYKINNRKVGFPVSALPKVLNLLEEKNIYYLIYNSDDEEVKFNEGVNKYNKFISLAKQTYNKNRKILNLQSKLDSLTNEKLDKIIDYIEEVINE